MVNFWSISMFLVLLEPVSHAEFKYVCIIWIGNQIREIFTADSRCRVKCRSGPIFTRIFSNFSGGRANQRASLGFLRPFLQADWSAYSEFKSITIHVCIFFMIHNFFHFLIFFIESTTLLVLLISHKKMPLCGHS